MATAIGFEAFVIGQTGQTLILKISKESASVFYVPIDSLHEVPEGGTTEVTLILGKPNGSMTIVTSIDSDRSHPLVVNTFVTQGDTKFKSTTFQQFFDTLGKDSTGDTPQGGKMKLGNYVVG